MYVASLVVLLGDFGHYYVLFIFLFHYSLKGDYILPKLYWLMNFMSTDNRCITNFSL